MHISKKTAEPVKNLHGVALSAVLALLLFLTVRILFRDSQYAIPLLALSAVPFALTASNLLWRLACCGTLISLYFLLEFTFNAGQPPFSFLFVLFAAGTLTISACFAGEKYSNMRRERSVALDQCAKERTISDLSTRLLTASDRPALCELILRSIYSVTDCPAVLFLPDGQGAFPRVGSYPEGLLLYPVEESVRDCFENNRPTGRGTPFFSNSVLRFFPVCAEGHVLAVAALLTDPEKPLERSYLETVESLLIRAGIVLDRLSVIDREQKILMEKETERIRSDFLRAISHDFRTPLTGIIGACSTLEQKDVTIDEVTSRNLIRSINEEANWLLRMVENLLIVTRVGPSGHKLNRSLEPLEEVLLEVLEKARNHYPQADIRVTQPADLLLLPMDPTLIVQVLSNLIENAVKFADGDHRIDLIVEEQPYTVTITVRDYGRGLSDGALKNLFEPINHHDGDLNHGMGLGLSICKSIIRAHGGTIEGRNDLSRGAVFTITLPKEGQHE